MTRSLIVFQIALLISILVLLPNPGAKQPSPSIILLPIAANPFYSFINLNWDNSLQIKEYNITETYRNWRDETVPNHGFEIYSTTVGCNNACVYIGGYTSDDTTNAGEYRPYLKIYENTIGMKFMLAKQMGLHCYPNPATNEATLEFS